VTLKRRSQTFSTNFFSFQHQVAQGRQGLPDPSGEVQHYRDPRDGEGDVQAEDRRRREGRRRKVLVSGDQRVRNVALHRRRHHLG